MISIRNSYPLSIIEFWNRIVFLIDNFHLVYKNILYSQNILILESQSNFIDQFVKKNLKNLSHELLKSELLPICKETSFNAILQTDIDVVLLEVLQHKNSKEISHQIISIDKSNQIVKFYTIDDKLLKNFSIVYKNDCIEIVFDSENHWMKNCFSKKTLKILCSENGFYSKSLCLVPIDKYGILYNKLKDKYAEFLIKNWTENTDALKYVYEDIGIATYLIVFWNELQIRPSFIDLGCGNGLLVYLLISEGFCGYGIDIRKRKIWDIYPKEIILKVETIEPSINLRYEHTDWIIGNHSDELTPWIPIISAQTSVKCNFFIIPCCCFDFNGQKYQRKNARISQYNDYLQYVKEIAENCGFSDVRFDKLRIPSTKRTCLIGQNCTNYSIENIVTILDSKKIEKIRLRASKEDVKNCTQIDRNIVQNITLKIVCYLLSINENVIVSDWNSGGVAKVHFLITLLNYEERNEIRKEHGGLKTLLRNQHQVFTVTSDLVQIRIPTKVTLTNSKNYKTRNCWFYLYHPNKCPLDDIDCSYVH